MNEKSTTFLLLTLIVLAAMWASGRLERVFRAVFG